jgi:hypothetical protein
MWAASRAGDQRFRRWSTKYERAIASPRTIQAFTSAFLEDRGMHWLKGVEGHWQLYAVARP